jgi:hypothetical protein
MTEKIEKLVSKIKENRTGLFIARLPPKTKEAFIALAHEEFCDDYGMTLKWLIDGLLTKDTELLLGRLEQLEARLAEFMAKEPEPPTRKMCDGTKRRIGK